MITEQPLFTVATITYNSGKWVRQAIESVLASSFTDFELLISDDCSTDDTWDIIQQYSDPRIKAWRNEKNIGEYPNRNKVLNAAKGRLFLFIDGDDLIYPYGLEIFSHYVRLFPEAAMVYCIPPRPYYILPVLLTPREVYLHDYFGRSVSLHGFTYTLFLTEVLRNAGGFSEKYRLGDNYIKRKISALHPAVLAPEGLTWWRVTENQASIKAFKTIEGVLEELNINLLALEASNCPLSEKEKDEALKYLKKGFIKNQIFRRVLKFKAIEAFKLFKLSPMQFKDIKCVFQKVKLPQYSYSKFKPQSDFERLRKWI